jgi:hypothetical protein
MTRHETLSTLPKGAGRLLLIGLGVILAAGLCLEGAVRASGYRLPRWYPTVAEDQAWRAASNRVVFVGTSRTFASVDERAFSGATGVIAVNMGQGFSTITTHALGLRYLAERAGLAGATVVIEAPGGLPDPATWQDPWFSAERPQWLLSVLRLSDYPALWRSTTPLEDTLTASFRGLAVGSRLAAYREDVRVSSLGWVYDRVRGRSSTDPERDDQEDIVLPVRRNPADRERIRETAVLEGQRWLVGTRHVHWDTTVVATMVKTVQAAGGRVVFLSIPLSSAMTVGIETPLAHANRQSFDVAMTKWGTPLVMVPGEFGDEEIPDLWHLSRRARDRFTAGLVEMWSRTR